MRFEVVQSVLDARETDVIASAAVALNRRTGVADKLANSLLGVSFLIRPEPAFHRIHLILVLAGGLLLEEFSYGSDLEIVLSYDSTTSNEMILLLAFMCCARSTAV